MRTKIQVDRQTLTFIESAGNVSAKKRKMFKEELISELSVQINKIRSDKNKDIFEFANDFLSKIFYQKVIDRKAQEVCFASREIRLVLILRSMPPPVTNKLKSYPLTSYPP